MTFATLVLILSLNRSAIVAQSVEDVYKNEILASRISAGSYEGGYLLNEKAGGMSFYFVSVGLQAVVTDPRFEIGTYLSLYLSKANSYGLVQNPANLSAPSDPDADDSEAATFLLLAADYYQTVAGKAWWKANATGVKAIATKVLIDNQVATGAGTGLISTFSKYRVAGKNAAVTPGKDTAYLMDECEDYGGLKGLANVLSSRGDSSATTFASSASLLASAISRFYSSHNGCFFWAATNIHENPAYSGGHVLFYPNRLAQIFPELYAVPLGTTTQTRSEYTAGWNYLNAGGDHWYNGFPTDGSVNGFPMMEIGYVAGLRSLSNLANTQRSWFDATYAKDNYLFWGIDQLGFRLRMGD